MAAVVVVTPSGQRAAVDIETLRDSNADSFSELVCDAFASVPAGSRVVGFAGQEGVIFLPRMVFSNPEDFKDTDLKLVLDYADTAGYAPESKSGEGKAGEEESGWLRFTLFPGDTTGLYYSASAIAELQALVTKTGFSQSTIQEVSQAFTRHAEGGMLSKRGFDHAIRDLVPRERLSKEDRQTFSTILNSVFTLFDRHANNTVDVNEFMAGFSVFCAGSKSTKLAFAFRGFDADADGKCSRREVWRFLRSFLTALFALSSSELPTDGSLRTSIHDIVDDTSVEATHLIFSSSGQTKRIAFDVFGEWYNTGGFRLLPWLELLDLKKWPFGQEGAQPPPPPAAQPPPAAYDGIDAPVLAFELSNETRHLEFTANDVQRFADLVSASGLGSMPPKPVARDLVKAEADSMLSQDAFLSVVRSFLPPEVLEARFSLLSDHTVESALGAIFGAFDTYGGEVDTNEFVSGFLLLLAGPKSEKLSLAFHLFDADNTGRLQRRSVWKFLRSFLTALACLSSACAVMEQDDVQRMVDSGAVEMTANLFLNSEREDAHTVSFPEFGEWYNKGGFLRAPWLELLDHNKWHPAATAGGGGDAGGAPAPGASVESLPSSASEGTPPDAAHANPVLLEFALNSAGDKLELRAQDCASLHRVVVASGLSSTDPEHMHTLFNTRTHDGYLSKPGFDACIRQLVPGGRLSDDDKRFLSFTLSVMFHAFSTVESPDSVPFDEFSAGFSLLAAGTKSDKLALAFRLFDHDEDGYLNRKQLFSFLRGFLTALTSTQATYTAMDGTGMRTVVNGAAVEAADSIFTTSAALSRPDFISYEEFGTWYNDGGYLVLPWLELLDLRKWPAPPFVGEDHRQQEAAAPADAATPPVLFAFDIAPGHTLSITTETTRRLQRLLRTGTFAEMDAGHLHAVFHAESRHSVLKTEGFRNCILRLLDASRVQASTAFLSAAMDSLFNAFDHTGTGAVDFAEFAAGFSMLASGSKSDKLSLAFQLFDADNDGRLEKMELWRFLRSFLTMLVALTAERDNTPRGVVDRASVDLTRQVFDAAGIDAEGDGGGITYAQFGQWYNDGGFEVVPWLELLDLKKWPSAEGGEGEERDTAAAPPPRRAAPPAAPPADDDGEECVYEFPASRASELTLVVTKADASRLHRLVTLSSLKRMDASAVQLVLEAESTDGLVDRDGFRRAVARIVDVDSLSDGDRAFITASLGALFRAFDRGDGSSVDAVELAIGMSTLCAGSKSDKLSLAFRLLDDAFIGSLSKSDLWKHMRSVLTMLVALQSGPASALSPNDVQILVNRAAMDCSLTIFKEAERGEEARITYKEFGQWYNDGGFRTIPWLELLDVSKWGAAPAAAAAGASTVPTASEEAPTMAAPPRRQHTPAASPPVGDVVFEFPLGDADVITITDRDIQSLQRVLAVSRFGSVEPDALHALFQRNAAGGGLTKDAFEACMRASVPGEALSEGDAAFLSAALTNIFNAFDSNGDGLVDEQEFSAGFSMLASGSKSDKLSLAFRVFDADNDGYISKMEMWRYLKGFITVLLTLSSSFTPSRTKRNELVNRAAMALTHTVFADADVNHDNRISYEEFGKWYNDGGFRVVPWLELLDVRKWPAAPPAGGGGGFVEPLTSITITAEEVGTMEHVLSVSGLQQYQPSHVVRLFREASDGEGTLTKDAFDAVVRSLIPGGDLSDADKQFLSFTLSCVFQAFDREGAGAVDATEFACGFALLASGSKSDKLSLAFRAFDDDGDGCLTRTELWQFLRAFLTGLYALKECGKDGFAGDDHDRLLIGTETLASGIMREAETAVDGLISYEEFGRWYNDGGYDSMFWLELLDLGKWQYVQGGEEGEEGWAPPAGAAGDAGSDAGDDSVLFEFPLFVDSERLVIRRADAGHLNRLLATSGLGGMDAEDVSDAFDRHAVSGSLTREAFDAAIRDLIPGGGLTDTDKTFLSFALSNLFFAFDRDDTSTVDFTEFVAGFSLLASGSKSDKLSLAFRLFDEDGDGFISRTEMWRYLRAFLTVFVALQGDASLAANRPLIGREAVDLTALIFRQADTNLDGKISYQEFGQWYNEGGFEVVPWLELLDLRKWPAPGGNAADGEGDGADVVFRFSLLPDDSQALELTFPDCSRMQHALQRSQLTVMTPDELRDAFAAAVTPSAASTAADARVSRATFLSVLASAATVGDRSVQEVLSAAFSAFDADGVDSVDATQLLTGALVFVGGSKSDKLSVAFRAHDDDGDDFLTMRQLERFLAGFLTCLASVSSRMRALPRDTFRVTIDRAVHVIVASVGSGTALSKPGHVSYVEFGRWYNSDGHKLTPWIELLDTGKWPNVLDDGDVEDAEDEDYTTGDAEDDDDDDGEEGEEDVGGPEGVQGEGGGEGEGEGEEDEQHVFVFRLSADWPSVRFRKEDVRTLHRIVELSNSSTLSPDTITAAMLEHATDGALTKTTFNSAIRSFVDGSALTRDQQRFLTSVFSEVFKAFKREGSTASAAAIGAGMTLLASGAKSAKLSHAFSLFDADDNGKLSPEELAGFVKAFLTVLVTLSDPATVADHTPEDVKRMLDAVAAEVAGKVFADTSLTDSINYAQFGRWYNDGGFDQVPWLELLDLRKWPA